MTDTCRPATLAGRPDRCDLHGALMVNRTVCLTPVVLGEVARERIRQNAQYGTNDATPDGTGPATRWLLPFTSRSASSVERHLRDDYEAYEQEAPVTWVHLLREEMAEAFAEDNLLRLEAELVQVAALAVSWVESLRARGRLQVDADGKARHVPLR